MKELKNVAPAEQAPLVSGVSRRRFLGFAGGLAGAGLLISSCKKEDKVEQDGTVVADLGRNDEGLLNLLFVIQQVEADLYAKVLLGYYNGMSPEELALFQEMAKHEIAHRELLRNYLRDRGTVVSTDFSSYIDFTSRESVLQGMETIENLCVAVMNEVSRLLISVEHTALVLKISSLEARHAATISNLRILGGFFNTVDNAGQEQGMLPSVAVTTINRFLVTKVSGNNLPNK